MAIERGYKGAAAEAVREPTATYRPCSPPRDGEARGVAAWVPGGGCLVWQAHESAVGGTRRRPASPPRVAPRPRLRIDVPVNLPHSLPGDESPDAGDGVSLWGDLSADADVVAR